MRGRRLIKKIDQKLLEEISADYKKLILKEKVKENLFTVGKISGQILLVAGVLAGGVILATIAPNVIGAIGKMAGVKREKIYFRCRESRFNQGLAYLNKQKLIRTIQDSEGMAIELTNKGRRRFQANLLENITIAKPKRWDRQWRIVIFDISEKFKTAREALRERLQRLGFYQIQKSVFIFPYPCAKEINFIKQIFGLDYQVRIILSSGFEGEEEIKKYFGLV